MPSLPQTALNARDAFSMSQSGLPSSTLPFTEDMPISQWQPTNDVDPDQNVSIFLDSAQRLIDSCMYYSDDSLNTKLRNFSSNSFSVLHHNVRGLISSYTEIESFLYSKSIKIVGLCETFLTPTNRDLFTFTGYSVVHRTRSVGRRGGGVSLLIESSLSYTERNDLSSSLTSAESIFIEIPREATAFNKTLIIGEVYRPPNGSKTNFINDLDNLLNSFDRSDTICYFMGDINIDLMVCDSDPDSINYINAFSRHAFYPLISRPTRLASGTLLDHIFTNSYACFSKGRFFSGVALTDLSDHFPVIHVYQTSCTAPSPSNSIIRFQLISERTISALRNKLGEIDWTDLLTINDVNSFYDRFLDRLSRAYNECIPVIEKRYKTNHKPWITHCISKSIKEKNRLYATYVKHPCEYSRERYRSYKNRLNHLLRVSERNYAREQLQKYSANLKNQWKVINSIIERKQHSRLPLLMRTDANQDALNDPNQIANEMNSFFVNAGISVIAQNPPSVTDPLSFLPNVNSSHSMYARPATEREISKIIDNLKNSACGTDQFKRKVIKEVKAQLIQPVLHLVNLSLKSGIFPEKLKDAVITPVFKKGSKELIGNYRPISVLNVFSKILEKVMYERLISYVEATQILYNRQFGFRKGCSTEMAVTEAVSIVTKALNEKSSILAVNMDLSKAFDTINHEILCRKLAKYGLSGNILRWFISYLSNRKQMVKYNNTLSTKLTVKCGVPQGSNLGPLLFILYINDLQTISDNCDAILYADDCNLFFKLNGNNFNSSPINDRLREFSDWFSCNHLALNTQKTNYMVFSGRRKVNITGININGSNLKQVTHCNFLGICVDQALTWKQHILATSRKIAKSIGILRKVSKKLSKSIMLQLYNSFIVPYLQYGITLWGASSKSSLEPIFVLQKKALKLALDLPMRTSTASLFQGPKIRPLRDLYKLYVAIFMYKYNTNALPACFSNYFVQNLNNHRYNTRSATLYRLPLFSTVSCQKSMLFQGPKLWNTIPAEIRQSASIATFKARMRVYLADSLNPL